VSSMFLKKPSRRRGAPQSSTLSAALAALAMAACVFAAPSANADEADAHFKRGQELAKKGELVEAEEAFEAAWSLRKAWDIAGNLGLVEAERGKWLEAAEHLHYALEHVGGIAKQEHRRALERRYEEALQRVVSLKVSTPAGSIVSVDARDYPVPSTGAEHRFVAFAEGGRKMVVEARRPGYEPRRYELEGAVGQALELRVELVESAGGTGGGGPGEEPDEPRVRRPMWPAFVLGGVAAVGVGLGVTGLVVSGGAYSDAEEGAQLGAAGSGCGIDGARCASAVDSLDSANTMRGLGIGGLAVGGAALAGMIVYLVLPDGGEVAQGVRIGPSVGAMNGLSLGGSF